MADTPFFSWATDALDVDDISTKLQPPIDIQNTGIVKGEPIARVWLNYMFNRLFTRLEPEVGDVIQTTLTLTTDAHFAKYGGLAVNWEFIGSTTLTGGSAGTVNFYKRIS